MVFVPAALLTGSGVSAVVPQNQLCASDVIADPEACSASGGGAGFAGRG